MALTVKIPNQHYGLSFKNKKVSKGVRHYVDALFLPSTLLSTYVFFISCSISDFNWLLIKLVSPQAAQSGINFSLEK